MTSPLEDWLAAAVRALGIDDAVDLSEATALVLDVARDVAHGVDRPAAPVTAFLIGLAAGRAADSRAALPDQAAIIRELVARWPS